MVGLVYIFCIGTLVIFLQLHNCVGKIGYVGIPPVEIWKHAIDTGLLDREYVSWVGCENTQWDGFRILWEENVRLGHWNQAHEGEWLQSSWSLAKSAESMLEMWHREDLGGASDANESVEEVLRQVNSGIDHNSKKSIDTTVMAEMAAAHLARIAQPPGTEVPTGFGGRCLLGLVAATVTIGRTLAALESPEWNRGYPVGPGSSLWRREHGYILGGLLLFESVLVLDLFVAPGWPGVDSRMVEQLLAFKGETSISWKSAVRGDQIEKLFREQITISSPILHKEDLPTRMPPRARMNRATDPMGVTAWGCTAGATMSERLDQLENWSKGGSAATPGYLSPNWIIATVRAEASFAKQHPKVNVLAIITAHASLDLEIPSLLESLFPQHIFVKYLLRAARNKYETICAVPASTSVVASLCSKPQLKALAPEFGTIWRNTVYELNTNIPSPSDPELLFESGGAVGKTLPHVVTVNSWVFGIWVIRHFPEIRVLVNFGGPVLFHHRLVGEERNRMAISDLWKGFDELVVAVRQGYALITAESIFRAEQLFFQTGVHVPFLRPMSVWINATYSPAIRNGPKIGKVILHSRGRLKYEQFFARSLQLMAGPAFKFEIAVHSEKLLPFEEMGTYHAVMILPWSPELCILRNLFKMAVPLFVPERALLRNMVHVSNQRAMPHQYSGWHPHRHAADAANVHPYDPFRDTILPTAHPRGVAARAYWAEYSEFLLLPCLRHFSGPADLILRLQKLEGRKLSTQMKAAHKQDMLEMRSFWLETLANMLI